MKKWTDSFLEQCLDGLPKDEYRKRTQAELTDHLMELYNDLESGGYSPEEAQARAVELMGEPEDLNKVFRAEWVRRASRWSPCLKLSLKWAFYGLLFNILSRFFVLIPLLSPLGNHFRDMTYRSPYLTPPVIILSLACFLPGLWFAVQNACREFSLLPYRHQKRMVYPTVLFTWVWDMVPLLLTFIFPPIDDLSFFFVVCMHLPFLLENYSFLGYLWTITVLCPIFALLYRPRRTSGGELRDLDN